MMFCRVVGKFPKRWQFTGRMNGFERQGIWTIDQTALDLLAHREVELNWAVGKGHND